MSKISQTLLRMSMNIKFQVLPHILKLILGLEFGSAIPMKCNLIKTTPLKLRVVVLVSDPSP